MTNYIVMWQMQGNIFTHRVVLPWNTLSPNIVNSLNVETFKARYDKERLNISNLAF